MGRSIFFAVHFIGGFLLLWLLNQAIHVTLLPDEGAPLWVEAGIETLYLVAAVVWGNVGWDSLKRITANAPGSLLVYVLSRTLAPVAIWLPLFLIPMDFIHRGHLLPWKLAATWQNGLLLILGIAVFVLQRVYRRSENAFFYGAPEA